MDKRYTSAALMLNSDTTPTSAAAITKTSIIFQLLLLTLLLLPLLSVGNARIVQNRESCPRHILEQKLESELILTLFKELISCWLQWCLCWKSWLFTAFVTALKFLVGGCLIYIKCLLKDSLHACSMWSLWLSKVIRDKGIL